ncbi:MAG: hypothetical protein AAF660_13775 [Pseudomonadota bacterium]
MNKVVMLLSLLTLLVSFWNRNALPRNVDFVPSLIEEPLQRATQEQPFEISYNGVDYVVAPEYRYDITGMVVSYRHHTQDNSRMHRLSADHLNMMDLCVIWGDNRNAMLNKIEFWNGIFTCNVSTRNREAWNSFDMNQLSNNHLLSTDERIRDEVKAVRVGDQIRIQGYLASYTGPTGTRGTSTTRTDTGDGACETIFIDTFRIVESTLSVWRVSLYASIAVLLTSLAVHFRRPYRPHR